MAFSTSMKLGQTKYFYDTQLFRVGNKPFILPKTYFYDKKEEITKGTALKIEYKPGGADGLLVCYLSPEFTKIKEYSQNRFDPRIVVNELVIDGKTYKTIPRKFF